VHGALSCNDGHRYEKRHVEMRPFEMLPPDLSGFLIPNESGGKIKIRINPDRDNRLWNDEPVHRSPLNT
jgi:hypothetical protein